MKSFLSSVLLAGLALVAPASARGQQATPTLAIESLEVVQPERMLHSVRIRVRNLTTEPQTGIVWYVLAAPGELEPWRVHDYASPERTIEVLPGTVTTVELAGPDDSLDGRFALSVWLHGKRGRGGERFHSDMRNHDVPIVIAPPFSFSIDYFVRPTGTKGEMHVLVRFSVRNNQRGDAHIGLDYRITPLGEDPEPDMMQLARVAEISAGVDYVVTVRHPSALPRQRLKLTGWIYEVLDDRLLYRGTDVTPIELKD